MTTSSAIRMHVRASGSSFKELFLCQLKSDKRRHIGNVVAICSFHVRRVGKRPNVSHLPEGARMGLVLHKLPPV